jgi:hypothetical protein
VEREVPQSTQGNGKAPAPNVVRLGDWIGPREDLVPLGRRAPRSDADWTAEEDSPTTSAVPEAPPSASDFWGERSAAIHHAVQGPSDEWGTAGAGNEAHAEAAQAGPTAPAVVRRFARRGAPIACAAGLALAAVAALALVLNPFGMSGQSRTAGAGRVRVASVLSDGLARILRLDLPLIEPRTERAHAAARTHRDSIAVATRHPRYVSQPVRYVAPPSDSQETDPVQASATRPPPASPSPTSAPDSTSSTTPAAPVTPTGEAGALGPIQSPNG